MQACAKGVLAVDCENIIIIINNAAREFLGIRKNDNVLQRPLLEVFRNAELNTFLVALEEDTGDFQESEMDIQVLSEPIRTFLLSGLRVEFQEGRLPGYLLVFNEITQLKKLEKMRQDFIANVSHELKTPITSITGLIETLSTCVDDDPENAKRFVGLIERNAKRLNDIIDDLLQLSNLEHGGSRIQAEFQLQNIRNTIQQAQTVMDEKLRKKRITCINEIEDCPILANHGLLEEALSNLIGNAIKYSLEGSEITINATFQDEELEIIVQDNGVGIPLEHQDRIFERFYRVDKSRDRQTGGTGLGLSIVKHVIQLHNGTVAVESQPGKGTRFIIRLPVERTPGSSTKPKDVRQVIA